MRLEASVPGFRDCRCRVSWAVFFGKIFCFTVLLLMFGGPSGVWRESGKMNAGSVRAPIARRRACGLEFRFLIIV